MPTLEHHKTCLALDFGGTKLLIAEVDENANILQSKQYPTGYLTQEECVKVLTDALDDYIETVGFVDKKPETMGLGIIGQIDNETGVWVMIDPSRKTPMPLAKLLSERYGMACRIENDVKAATRAERCYGEGNTTNDFIYINVGTGIAAGFISGGRLIRGYGNDAGEVGHMVVQSDSPVQCACGRYGCAEALASGSGILRQAGVFAKRYPNSKVTEKLNARELTTSEICSLAKEGDVFALKIISRAADALADLIMNLVKMANPEKIILGGGVASNRWFMAQVEDRLIPEVMQSVMQGVVLSGLDPRHAGLLGATAVGFNR